jgi:hypothetical protein
MSVAKTCVVALLALSWGAPLAQAENPLFADLMRDGVPISPKESVPLPEPTLADGLSAAQQRQALAGVIGERYSWEEFTRRAVVAPLVLRISDDAAQKKSLGRRVDLWFVAYGDLKTLASDEFLEGQFRGAESSSDAESDSRITLLTDADLKKRRIDPPRKESDPRFIAAEVTLLDRVRISGTTRSVKTTSADSVLVASLLDDAFAEDVEFPNRWRPITRDDAGRKRVGEPHTYEGLGSYVKATRLVEPKGALLIEYHIAFGEPAGWFNGANLLRSKLPLVAQDSVRKFRRNLEKK